MAFTSKISNIINGKIGSAVSGAMGQALSLANQGQSTKLAAKLLSK